MTRLLKQILVVGAGPAGIAAAIHCALAGRDVLVVDDNASPGGQIWRGGSHISQICKFKSLSIGFLPHARVIDANAQSQTVIVETPENSFEIRWEKLVIATGAKELFLPFPGWTLPGITGVGGLQVLAKSGLPLRDKTVVIAGSGPLLLAVAANLRSAGARISLVAEQAPISRVLPFTRELLRHPQKVLAAAGLRLRLLGVPYRFGCWVTAAHGNDRLRSVTLRQGNRTWSEPCDYAGVAYGLVSNTELAALVGCSIENGAVVTDNSGRTSVENVFCAGEASGIGGVEAALFKGEQAAGAICGDESKTQVAGPKHASFAQSLKQSFELRPELRKLCQPDTIVCRCEDVTFRQLQHLPSFRAAKLQARCGMGSCQARVCGPALQFLFSWKSDSIRPPLFPGRVATLAKAAVTNSKG